MKGTNEVELLENNNYERVHKSDFTIKPPEEVRKNGRFHINRKLFPLKITLFLFYGGMAAILPYLTIHMKDIGISMSQIGIIYAALPFTAFLGPPIMGFMADKMGQYKPVLVIATVTTGIAHTLLLLVPKYSQSPIYTHAVIEFNNGFNGSPVTVLRPLEVSHCQQFLDSLRNRQRVASDYHDNNVFAVHSCKWGDGGNESSPLASGVVKLWNIPSLCRQIVEKSSNLQAYQDGESIVQLVCGKENKHMVDLYGGDASSSTILFITTSDSKCSVNVGTSGITTGQGVQQQVTCLTNYTFPTGRFMENGNATLTFWIYFLIRVVGNLFLNSCFTLLDATTLAVVKRSEGAEYGKQRIFSVLGFGLISPLAGLLVDTVSSSKGYTDYSPAFYVADGMLCLNVIGYLFMQLDVEKPEESMWKDMTALLRFPEVVVFLVMVFFIGNMWGFFESYLFIFLDELQAPKYLLGLTLTVGSLASVPFLYGAAGLVAQVGRVNIIALAFLAYFVRAFGYSYIPNPFWCFPLEAMEALTYHLMWAAAATYCAVLAPKGLLGTLTGVTGSLHYGLGKGSGAFIGGYVISFSSTRLAFRYFGIFGGTMGVIYFLINILWLKASVLKRNEREAKKESNDRGRENGEQKHPIFVDKESANLQT